MATITLTSACNTNLLAYENNNNHVRAASFSSYISNNEETFILKLAESTQKPSPPTTKTAPEHPYQISFGRKKTEESEIGVFSAEKYFNNGIDEEKTRIAEKNGRKHQPKKDLGIDDLHQIKPKIKPGTPSSGSEVSWNSQSALLPSFLRDPSTRRRIKANSKGFFAAFGCRCSCSDKKSIGIDESVGENTISANYKTNTDLVELHGRSITKVPIEMHQDPVSLFQIKQTRSQSGLKEEIPSQKIGKAGLGLLKEDRFTFPISNLEVGNLTVKFEKEEDEKDRKSLEVFGSPVLAKEDIAISLERRLTMLTWDSNPRTKGISATPYNGGTNDDIESDSSSDLFEIKSLASNVRPSFSRQASDGLSSCMSPNACYEPSEASIEWSVVTASAANFSVASDYDEQKPRMSVTNPSAWITPTKNMSTKAKTAMGKEVPRRRPSMLSGCRSHKAVNVEGEAYLTPEKVNSDPRRAHGLGSFTPIAKFKAETKLTDFESAHVQPAFASHPVYMH